MEQQLFNIHLNKPKMTNENATIYDNIRSTALSIYEQYLGEKSHQKILLNPSLVQTLFFRIRNLTETPSGQWFDEIQTVLYEKLRVKYFVIIYKFESIQAYLLLLFADIGFLMNCYCLFI